MVQCCVSNCNRHQKNTVKLRFFRIPKKQIVPRLLISKKIHKKRIRNRRRDAWIKIINRSDLNENSRVCSLHFSSGKPSKTNDINNIDWVPHINMERQQQMPSEHEEIHYMLEEEPLQDSYFVFEEEHEEKHKSVDSRKEYLSSLFNDMAGDVERNDQSNDIPDIKLLVEMMTEQSIKMKLLEEKFEELKNNLEFKNRTNDGMIYNLQEIMGVQKNMIDLLNSKLEMATHNESAFENDDARSRYYTGVNFAIINIIYTRLEPLLPSHGNRKLSKFQSLILTLMRLRLGSHFVDLGYRFNIGNQTASKIFYEVLYILYYNLKQLIVWPERDVVRSTMPKMFLKKLGHNRLVCTIDCFEVFVERPSDPLEYCQYWSSYKHHETIKYLIGKTPQGSISFISETYVGRASDKFIVNDCGILNLIKEGDYLAADRG